MAEQVVVIGAGPAGLAAAIQLQRYGLQPRVLERAQPGGLLRNANWVENYPGFPKGISGPELVQLMLHQAARAGVQIENTAVQRLSHNGEFFSLDLAGQELAARRVVIATGTRARHFRDFDISEDCQARIRYDVYSLLAQTSRTIAIIGAGDAAFDYALNLAKRGNQVHILNRGQVLKCLPLLWQRSQQQTNISYQAQSQVLAVERSSSGKLLVSCTAAGREITLEVDYILGAIGRSPEIGFISQHLQGQLTHLESQGWLYQVGDVCNGLYRQTAIAAGNGLQAAMRIYQYIQEDL